MSFRIVLKGTAEIAAADAGRFADGFRDAANTLTEGWFAHIGTAHWATNHGVVRNVLTGEELETAAFELVVVGGFEDMDAPAAEAAEWELLRRAHALTEPLVGRITQSKVETHYAGSYTLDEAGRAQIAAGFDEYQTSAAATAQAVAEAQAAEDTAQ